MEDMAVMKNVLKDLEVELKTKGRFFGAKQLHCQQMRILVKNIKKSFILRPMKSHLGLANLGFFPRGGG